MSKKIWFFVIPALLIIVGAVWFLWPQTITVASLHRDDDGSLSIERHQASSRFDAQWKMHKLRAEEGVEEVSIPGVVKSTAADPDIGKQWGLTRLDATDVWGLSQGAGITVAVVDSGVDGSHPDLSANVLPGYDVFGESDGRIDPNGHGTHVAGIIAAVKDNSIGGAGLAPSVKILPVRGLDQTGYGDDAGIGQGVLWAADHGADIINLSLGSHEKDPVLAGAVADVIKRGVVVVAASGNDGMQGSPVSYPGALPGVVAVGASSYGDTRAFFSTSGDYVSLSAPGMSIYSTWTGGGYSLSSGTSMATPYVAASFAVTQAHTGLEGQALIDRMFASATDVGAAGKDPEFGYGIVDPYAAMTDGKPRQPDPVSMPMPDLGNLPSLPGLPEMKLPELPKITLPELQRPTLPGLDPQLPDLNNPDLNGLKVTSSFEVLSNRNGEAEIILKASKIPLTQRDVEVEISNSEGNSKETLKTDGFGKLKLSYPEGSELKLSFPGDRLAKPSETTLTLTKTTDKTERRGR